MTFLQSLACAGLAVASTTSFAQFVKGNEAVKLMSDGSKQVETPPTTGALLAKPCPAVQPGCSVARAGNLRTARGRAL
jgi:hypothetical protein